MAASASRRSRCSSFLDNHDLPRFMFGKADPAIQRVALMYLFTWDGLPCVYYGTEQGFAGGVDPKNREDMFAGNKALGYSAVRDGPQGLHVRGV